MSIIKITTGGLGDLEIPAGTKLDFGGIVVTTQNSIAIEASEKPLSQTLNPGSLKRSCHEMQLAHNPCYG